MLVLKEEEVMLREDMPVLRTEDLVPRKDVMVLREEEQVINEMVNGKKKCL